MWKTTQHKHFQWLRPLFSREFPTWQGGGVSWAPSVARLVR